MLTEDQKKEWADKSIPKVKEAVATINDIPMLEEIKEAVDTKGGKEEVEARIASINEVKAQEEADAQAAKDKEEADKKAEEDRKAAEAKKAADDQKAAADKKAQEESAKKAAEVEEVVVDAPKVNNTVRISFIKNHTMSTGIKKTSYVVGQKATVEKHVANTLLSRLIAVII